MKVGQLNQRSTADRESQGLARRPIGKVIATPHSQRENHPADFADNLISYIIISYLCHII